MSPFLNTWLVCIKSSTNEMIVEDKLHTSPMRAHGELSHTLSLSHTHTHKERKIADT